MSQRFPALVLTIFVLIPGGLAGCGPSDETLRIKLVPVSGTVTFNGCALEGARITFTPDESNAALTPGGDTTGPQGNYKAMYRNRSGLAPGVYKIVVEKTFLPEGVKAEDNDMNMHLESLNPTGAKKDKSREIKQVRGEFDGEVAAGGAPLDFDVKGKATVVPEEEVLNHFS